MKRFDDLGEDIVVAGGVWEEVSLPEGLGCSKHFYSFGSYLQEFIEKNCEFNGVILIQESFKTRSSNYVFALENVLILRDTQNVSSSQCVDMEDDGVG